MYVSLSMICLRVASDNAALTSVYGINKVFQVHSLIPADC